MLLVYLFFLLLSYFFLFLIWFVNIFCLYFLPVLNINLPKGTTVENEPDYIFYVLLKCIVSDSINEKLETL